MELPPQPKLEDFPGSEYGYSHSMYKEALAAWERVCKDIIAANERKATADIFWKDSNLS